MDVTIELDRAEALLFDLGNVVVDIDFRRCTRGWADRAGIDHDELVPRFWFDDAYCAHEIGAIDTPTYLAHLREVLGVDLADDDLLEPWSSIFVGPTPGVADLLAGAAARWPLYGFTNTNPAHQAHWAPRFADHLAAFDRIFASHEIGLRKPERAAFDHVLAEIGVAPEAVIFFDDTPDNVDGARAAGLQAVLVTPPDAAASIAAALGFGAASVP